MNLRIEKLAEQAGLVGTNGHFEYDFFDPEKFAELIVRECALTLYKSAVQDKQAGFAHEAKIMELAGDMIKEHFEVEE
jgi:hypothetical protein